MEDLSLHILDIAENSINAGAKNVAIIICEDATNDLLTVEIADDGKGMSPEVAGKATDPFYTTRTTRRVGLGLALLNAATKATDGHLDVRSTPGTGTKVVATFGLRHIDRKPLGDIAATIVMLIAGNPDINFRYQHKHDGHTFTVDTKELKTKYPTLDLNVPETLTFLREYIAEHTRSLS